MNKTYVEMKNTVEALRRTQELLHAALPRIRDVFQNKHFKKMVFLGCGSSWLIAKSMAVAARAFCGSAACAVAAGDAVLHTQDYVSACDNALLVLISRSGETSELHLALDSLKKAGANYSVFGIYCTENSSLARKSTYSVEMPWAFDESVCQTRSVTAMYFAGVYLLALLGEKEKEKESLARMLDALPDFMEQVEPAMKELAKNGYTHAVTLADSVIAGLMEEGALAFKEICQIPSNFYHFLDCRHGPMVLFQKYTLIVAVCADPKNKLEADLLSDLVKKGCRVVVVSDFAAAHKGVLNFSPNAVFTQAARGLMGIVTCQFLSYFTAIQRGINPDTPAGLDACIIL